MRAHLTSGRSEFGGGLERYTFQVTASFIQAVAERSSGDPAVMHRMMADIYILSPRPDPRDIQGVKISPTSDPMMMEVELVIRRAHYLLAQMLHEHEGAVTIEPDGGVHCSCHPGGPITWIMRNTLPDYSELKEPPHA